MVLDDATASGCVVILLVSMGTTTRVAMAKLEKFVIDNSEATNLQSDNEVVTPEAEAPTALIQ